MQIAIDRSSQRTSESATRTSGARAPAPLPVQRRATPPARPPAEPARATLERAFGADVFAGRGHAGAAVGNRATQETLGAQGGSVIQAKTAGPGVGAGSGSDRGAHPTGIPSPVRSKMEAAFGAEFSGVRVHPRSSRAVELGALAYTQGEHVHFAPGQFQPESPAGQALLGHELAHVVQQRQGRVQATRQLKPHVWINDSSQLEQEAEALGRRAARGETGLTSAPRVGGPGREVIQGAFTAHAVVEGNNESAYAATDVNIADLKMSKKMRPPTKLKTAQGSHILAWELKVREWSALFVGACEAVLDKLLEQIKTDEKYDEESDTQKERPHLRHEVEWLTEAAQKLPLSGWTRYVSHVVTQYIKLYQKSGFTVYGGKVTPKGHGESSVLYNLDKWAKTLTGVTAEQVAEQAIDLVDVRSVVAEGSKYKALHNLVDALFTLFPQLFNNKLLYKPTDRQLAGLAYSYSKDELKHLLATGSTLEPTRDPPPGLPTSSATSIVPKPDEVDTAMASEPFVARARAELKSGRSSSEQFQPTDVTVKDVALADERPDTQFRGVQGSHTIAWSLERRAWRRLFGDGQSLSDVRKGLDKTLNEDEKSAKDMVAAGDTDKASGDRTALMGEVSSALSAKSLAEWTELLDNWIERYVSIYQRSPFATFNEVASTGDSTPRGHGEGKALAKLQQWEDILAGGRSLPTTVMPDTVAVNALALLDLGETAGVRTRLSSVLDDLTTRWKEDFERAFPNVFNTYKTDIEAALDEEKTDTGRALPALDKRDRKPPKRPGDGDPGTSSTGKRKKTG
ncbi:DUF4157 domain-containing protein [Sorangium sp. So ce118]